MFTFVFNYSFHKSVFLSKWYKGGRVINTRCTQATVEYFVQLHLAMAVRCATSIKRFMLRCLEIDLAYDTSTRHWHWVGSQVEVKNSWFTASRERSYCVGSAINRYIS